MIVYISNLVPNSRVHSIAPKAPVKQSTNKTHSYLSLIWANFTVHNVLINSSHTKLRKIEVIIV